LLRACLLHQREHTSGFFIMVAIEVILVVGGGIMLDLLIPPGGFRMRTKLVAKQEWVGPHDRPIDREMDVMGALVVYPFAEETALKQHIDRDFRIPQVIQCRNNGRQLDKIVDRDRNVNNGFGRQTWYGGAANMLDLFGMGSEVLPELLLFGGIPQWPSWIICLDDDWFAQGVCHRSVSR
jgi:hypothetical protein